MILKWLSWNDYLEMIILKLSFRNLIFPCLHAWCIISNSRPRNLEIIMILKWWNHYVIDLAILKSCNGIVDDDLTLKSWLWNLGFEIWTLKYRLWNIGFEILTLKSWLWNSGFEIVALKSRHIINDWNLDIEILNLKFWKLNLNLNLNWIWIDLNEIGAAQVSLLDEYLGHQNHQMLQKNCKWWECAIADESEFALSCDGGQSLDNSVPHRGYGGQGLKRHGDHWVTCLLTVWEQLLADSLITFWRRTSLAFLG